MEITWDVAVTMRDGVKIYVDVFKPEGAARDTKLPVIFTWSPYGKHGLKTVDMFPGADVPKGAVSSYAVWEGPDPLYWTKRGYAIVNGDSRGSWASEGDIEVLSPQLAYDGYDVIEWAAAQPWSNGHVGMAGVSYLAIVQWRIAQLNPPHLSAINPMGGASQIRIETIRTPGGIPETKFTKFTTWSCQFGSNKAEDYHTNQMNHELMDGYQESKRAAALPDIKVPAYVVADWGDWGLHTRGALIGFTDISSKHKWLEVHGRKKWQYYYQVSSLRRQEAFFQKFLKGRRTQKSIRGRKSKLKSASVHMKVKCVRKYLGHSAERDILQDT